MESTKPMPTVADRPSWRPEKARYRADVFLSQSAIGISDTLEGDCAGFRLGATMLEPGLPIPAELVRASQALVVEVRCDHPSSMERLQKLLAEHGGVPVIAAVNELSLPDVRRLMRTGVADILPLPLRIAELEPALERLAAELDRRLEKSGPRGRIVAAVKARGGVGATTVLTQLGYLLATSGKAGETCLVDLDLQAGNAALYLGQLPELGVKDLLDAGDRLDSALLRSALARHGSGLSFLAAPQDIIPLDSVRPDQVEPLIELVRREFQTVLVDLPSDWTDWSLSLLAHAERVLLVSELSIAGLHAAKRQRDFIRQQELGDLQVDVVMNKVTKGMFKSVDLKDAERILGRDVTFTIADDAPTVRSALDQGEAIAAIAARSRTARDLGDIAKTLAVAPAIVR